MTSESFKSSVYLSKVQELLQEPQASKSTENHFTYRAQCLYPATISNWKPVSQLFLRIVLNMLLCNS